jgi:hypothetical protein
VGVIGIDWRLVHADSKGEHLWNRQEGWRGVVMQQNKKSMNSNEQSDVH